MFLILHRRRRRRRSSSSRTTPQRWTSLKATARNSGMGIIVLTGMWATCDDRQPTLMHPRQTQAAKRQENVDNFNRTSQKQCCQSLYHRL